VIAISVIAIYSRKSKFTGKGNSIQNQIELCKEHGKKHFSVEHYLIYEDEGYSGGNTNRPMYKKMLKDALEHKFDVLICYRLDRISRNISDFSGLVELLRDNDIDFVSIRESFDTSTPMGRAMMYIASVFAQLERETISERIKDNMYHLAKTGRWLGGRTPTGFKSKQVEYYDNDDNKRNIYVLTAIPKDLELVKALYNKYLELGSLTKLHQWTLENNIKTRSNKAFDKSILRFILSNPVYTIADKAIYEYFSLLHSKVASQKEDFDGIHGLMVYNRHNEKKNKVIKRHESEWIVSVALHRGIISSEHWIAVQNLLKSNSRKAPRAGTGRTGLITNLLRCQCCGSKMGISISRKKNETYYYYKCMAKEKSRGAKCNVSNLNGKTADELILNEIKKFKFNKRDIYNNLYKTRKTLDSLSSKELASIYTKENKINYYKNCINNLTLRLSETENSKASKYIINQIEKFDNELAKLKNNAKHINENIRTINTKERSLKLILDLINNFPSNLDALNFLEKKKLIHMLIDGISWDGHILTINFVDI
jgi:site-specific DNA recombinase